MAEEAKKAIIMAWSKCKVEIGETGANDAPASEFTSVGTIKDKTSSLSAENGDVLQMLATGGELVGYEQQAGALTFTTTVIEPTDALYTLLGLGAADTDAYKVKTHVVGKEFTLKVTPKNKGAKGIIAPKCSVSFQPTYDEENGNGAILTFGILMSQALDYWYQRFTTETAL